MMRSDKKATLFVLACSAASIVSWSCVTPRSEAAVPHAVFYVTLLINTYFSIVTLTPLCASALHQDPIDVALGANYFLLATTIGISRLFETLSAILFALATLKYFIVAKMTRLPVIKRKLFIDALGFALCTAAVAGSCSGYPRETAWVMMTVFSAANFYLLALRPMYEIDQHSLTHVDVMRGEGPAENDGP
jgi:hypothetical protein